MLEIKAEAPPFSDLKTANDHYSAVRSRLMERKLVPVRLAPAPARPGPAETSPAEATDAPLPVARPLGMDEPLDDRLRLSRFVVGDTNRLAHAALTHASPGALNPLYVFGPSGLGKTHLLQGLAHARRMTAQNVLYLTGERFMLALAAATKARTLYQFKQALRSADALLIDDVQQVRGAAAQQELSFALVALADSGRQVALSADRPPSELDLIEARMRARLSAGLVVELSPFDEATALMVLEARYADMMSAHPAFRLAPDARRHIARCCGRDAREIEGVLNRLLAVSMLSPRGLTAEAMEEAIRLAMRREPRRVRMEDIQRAVAGHYGVTRADMLSQRRTANVVKPRQVAMYLAKTLTLRSLPEIGRRFGGRDHTTVLHAVRKIEAQEANDSALAAEIVAIRKVMEDLR